MKRLSLIIPLFLLMNNSNAFQFLKSSSLLNKHNVKVYTGKLVEKEKSLILDSKFSKLDSDKVYQATYKGKKKINAQVSEYSYKNCGEKTKGALLKINTLDSRMVFYNVPKGMEINWRRIQEVQLFMPPQCLSTIIKSPQDQIRYFTTVGDKDHFYMAMILKNKEKHLEYGQYVKKKANSCDKNTVYSKVYNIDGDIGAANNVTNFFGLLEIKLNNSKEEWIILDAHGYEGDGILAIPYKDFLKGDFKNQDWLIYNGC